MEGKARYVIREAQRKMKMQVSLFKKQGKTESVFLSFAVLSAFFVMVFISYGMSHSLGHSQGKSRPSQVPGALSCDSKCRCI